MSTRLTDALDCLDGGDWESAHAIAVKADTDTEDDGRTAAWLHAHLHRVEGDAENAEYWYRQAGRDPFEGSVDEEREALRAAVKD